MKDVEIQKDLFFFHRFTNIIHKSDLDHPQIWKGVKKIRSSSFANEEIAAEHCNKNILVEDYLKKNRMELENFLRKAF